MDTQLVECRSTQQINEDTVVEVHTQVQRHLRELCAGTLLYRGDLRRRLERVRGLCEEMILGTRPACYVTVNRAYLGALFTGR